MAKYNDGQTVVVTGASRGIGRATAELLHAEGARVIGTYNTGATEAETLVAAGIDMRHVDLASRQSIDALLSSLDGEELYGLVNNAGIVDFSLWEEFDIDSWLNVFNVNLHAPILLCHALRAGFADGGAIVNIASTDGFTGSFASLAYSASKAALINATKSLGNVFGVRNIRVNAIAPGWIDTGMSTDASYDAAGQTPLGRNGSPADVAAVVSFLLSREAKYVSGTTVVVDGGYTNVDNIMKKENEDLLRNSEDS